MVKDWGWVSLCLSRELQLLRPVSGAVNTGQSAGLFSQEISLLDQRGPRPGSVLFLHGTEQLPETWPEAQLTRAVLAGIYGTDAQLGRQGCPEHSLRSPAYRFPLEPPVRPFCWVWKASRHPSLSQPAPLRDRG